MPGVEIFLRFIKFADKACADGSCFSRYWNNRNKVKKENIV